MLLGMFQFDLLRQQDISLMNGTMPALIAGLIKDGQIVQMILLIMMKLIFARNAIKSSD